MKSKNKVFAIMASIIGMIIISSCNVSMAKSIGSHGNGLNKVKSLGSSAVGNTVIARYSDLTSRKDLYCVQHGASLRGNVTFTVSRFITITGNTATSDKGKSVTSIENGKLAYILNKAEGYGKQNNYTSTQKALYQETNSWYNAVGKSLNANMKYSGNNKYKNQKLVAEAEEYARNIGDTKKAEKATDNTNKSDITVTGYSKDNVGYLRVGPFKWTFDGSIDKVEVYGNNDTIISDVKFSKFKGEEEIFYDNSTGITSGKDFYITIRADAGFTKIGKIKATTKIKNASSIYTTKIWFLKSLYKQNLILVDTDSENLPDSVETPFSYNIKLTKDLVIEKVDANDKTTKLENVGFIIQNKETGKYVHKEDGKITYVDEDDKKNPPTEFVTDKDGKIEIDGLIMGTYLAYETKNPNYGYKQLDGSIEIAIGTTKQVIKNESEFIKLSGYVWLDGHSTKKTRTNDLYKTDETDYVDDQDISFNGLTVRLKDKEGNVINETITSELGLYSEIEGGEYIFKDILIDKVENYFVEFEYNGLIYQSVKTGKEKYNDSDTRNYTSKSTDKVERDILDKNFASVNSTGENRVNVNDKYTIIYNETVDHATSIKDSSDCILRANTLDAGYSNLKELLDESITEIRYVNLGLYVRPQADLSLTQDLENVNVGVNGYWHVYNYAKRTYDNSEFDVNKSDTWNLGVKFKNSYTNTYKRAIYESDINYETEDKNKELQVYLTYKIAITNESSYLTRANSIVDYFDNRYTLVGVGTGLNEKNEITGNISYQNSERYNDNYQKCVIDVNSEVKSGESNYIYVQFKLNREAIIQIMNKNETLSNRAEINSYTVFKDNNNQTTVAAVDRDSVPGNVVIENTNTYEDDTDAAPSVQLELADARKIEGNVFVDASELQTDNTRQGNGIFDNGELPLKDVKVTLHEVYNSISDITTKTDENGYFEFSGYIPGQYTITYIWGDKTYKVQDYKGTVYDSTRNQNDMYWYKDQVDIRKTDAIDNYQTRIAIDNETAKITDNTINTQIANAYEGGNNNSNITVTTMDSITPTMEFGVEYDTTVTDGTGDRVEFIVKNVDFGIVERARQQLDVTKRVCSLKITLTNGQVIVDATVDEKGQLSGVHDYVTYMGPSESNGYSNNGFIKAEIDNELIEGATLEVGYEIKFINNSEVDYMSEDYYKYGIYKETDNVVTLTPSAVVDYLDKDLSFDQNKNPDWKQITVEDLAKLNAVKVGEENAEFSNSRTILYTEATAKPIKPAETVSVNLNVSNLLTSARDLAFNNDVETVEVNKPEVPQQHKGSIIKYFPIDDAEEVDITPSTGENKGYVIPTIIGITSLLVISAGIFVIKKKIIDNK